MSKCMQIFQWDNYTEARLYRSNYISYIDTCQCYDLCDLNSKVAMHEVCGGGHYSNFNFLPYTIYDIKHQCQQSNY